MSEELEQQIVDLLQSYQARRSTEDLKKLAPLVIALRGRFQRNGQPDWSGYSPDYRRLMGQLLDQAGVPRQYPIRDRIQTALRYHVGIALREDVDASALAQAGLHHPSPKVTRRDRRRADAAHSTETERLLRDFAGELTQSNATALKPEERRTLEVLLEHVGLHLEVERLRNRIAMTSE